MWAAEPLSVHFFGNQVYDDATIARLAGLDFSTALTNEEIRQKLETTGFFSRVRVWREGNSLRILVLEKTPWFLFPLAARDSGKFLYGLGGGITGIAGSSAMALGRYQQGSGTKGASFMVRDDYFLDSLWILSASVDYEHSLRDEFRDRLVIERWQNKALNLSFQAGYHLRDDLVLQINHNVERHHFSPGPGRPASRGTLLSRRFLLEYGRLYVNEGLSQGFKMRPYAEWSFWGSDYRFYQLGAAAQASLYLDGDWNFVTRPRVEFGRPLPRFQQFQLGGANFRSFPMQAFRVQSYAVVQNDFFFWSFDTKRLVFRPIVYGDVAYVQKGISAGVGAGLYVYFRQVAMPALSLYGGYGFRPNGFSFSAAVGPQF